MDMIGERRIPATRKKVWDALNDPAVLKACIPGCQILERTGENEMVATAAVKIGPISARFNGKVLLTDLDPPNSYHISGEGQGGVAGFAKGGADVRLAEDETFTVLTYEVKAQVGGKLAQLGARLIDATSKQMAEAFFDRFTAEVATPTTVAAGGLTGIVAATDGEARTTARPVSKLVINAPVRVTVWDMIPKTPFGIPRIAMIGAVLCLILLILAFTGYVFG